jgi:hypothetical protein
MISRTQGGDGVAMSLLWILITQGCVAYVAGSAIHFLYLVN